MFYWFLISCLQVKRETHAQQRCFNRQSNRMKTKEKRVNLASNSKTETYNEQWCIKDNFLPLSQ